MRMCAVFLVLLVPTSYNAQTSYFAHYVGFLFGVVSGPIYYFLSPKKATKEEIAAELDNNKVDEQQWGDPYWEENLVSDIEERD